ncbi:hypothetical protein TNCV_4361531 [Trichonephila clavipes]|nr:hypothetical protein TNCV_4361531 [Trichonephila clavipes]
MPKSKIIRQVDNPDFACVVRTEWATICFTLYNAINMFAIVHYCNLLQKKSRVPELESLCEKKGVFLHEDFLAINGTKYSTFQTAAGVAGLSKSEDCFNEVLNGAASEMNLNKKKRQERILRKKINLTT